MTAKRQHVTLGEAQAALPTTIEQLALDLNASKRAAKRALQYLVHRGQATRDETGVFS